MSQTVARTTRFLLNIYGSASREVFVANVSPANHVWVNFCFRHRVHIYKKRSLSAKCIAVVPSKRLSCLDTRGIRWFGNDQELQEPWDELD